MENERTSDCKPTFAQDSGEHATRHDSHAPAGTAMKKADREREARERREKAAARDKAPVAGAKLLPKPQPPRTSAPQPKPQPLKTSALKGGARRELVFDAATAAPTLRFDQLPSVVTWMRQPELLPSPAAMPAGPDDESMALLEMEAESLPEPTSSSLQCLLSGSDDGCVAFSDGKVLIDGVFHKTGAPSSRTC